MHLVGATPCNSNSTSGLIEKINRELCQYYAGEQYIDVAIQTDGYGNLSLSNLCIEYIPCPQIYSNDIYGNPTGLEIEDVNLSIIMNDIKYSEYAGMVLSNNADVFNTGNNIIQNNVGTYINASIFSSYGDIILSNSIALDISNNANISLFSVFLGSNNISLQMNRSSMDSYGSRIRNNIVGAYFNGSNVSMISSDFFNNSHGINASDSLMVFKDCLFGGNNYSINLTRSSPIFRNCSLEDNNTYLLNISNNSYPTLYDTYFGYENFSVADISNITAYRTVNVWIGNISDGSMRNVTTLLKDQWGNEIFNGTTDRDGFIPTQVIRIYKQTASNINQTNLTLNATDPSEGTQEVNRSVNLMKGALLWQTYITVDSDSDGINNGEEEFIYFTDPTNNDTDRDGLTDGMELGLISPHHNSTNMSRFQADEDWTSVTELLLPDTDGDGLSDGIEDENKNGIVDAGETDPNNPDTDGDGVYDGYEQLWNVDTDGDGFINSLDTDSDGDGLFDGTEDANRNGRVDIGEFNPLLVDSDFDGTNDDDVDKFTELQLTSISGPGNYILFVNGISHPSNGTYKNATGLNETLVVGLILTNVTIKLCDAYGNQISGFLINATSEGTISLSDDNAILTFLVQKFDYWTNTSNAILNDTDGDSLNDLLEFMVVSPHK